MRVGEYLSLCTWYAFKDYYTGTAIFNRYNTCITLDSVNTTESPNSCICLKINDKYEFDLGSRACDIYIYPILGFHRIWTKHGCKYNVDVSVINQICIYIYCLTESYVIANGCYATKAYDVMFAFPR